MSTYTHRYVEVLREQINGYRWKFDGLPDPEEHVGEIYRINEYNRPEGGSKYYESVKETDDTPAHWDGRDSVVSKWEPIKWYFEKRKIDSGDPGPFEEEWAAKRNDFDTIDKFGKKHHLQEDFMWCNNGGYIRDDYIGHSFGAKYFQDRGLPADVSPEVKKDIEGDYHYGITYVTAEEWEKLFNEELAKFVAEVKKRFRDEKIEEILDKLKDVLSLNKKSVEILDAIQRETQLPVRQPIPVKEKKEKKKKEEDEETWWEDTIDYMFEEEIWRLFQIRDEIERCDFIVEELGDEILSGEKIRIIYYLA